MLQLSVSDQSGLETAFAEHLLSHSHHSKSEKLQVTWCVEECAIIVAQTSVTETMLNRKKARYDAASASLLRCFVTTRQFGT